MTRFAKSVERCTVRPIVALTASHDLGTRFPLLVMRAVSDAIHVGVIEKPVGLILLSASPLA